MNLKLTKIEKYLEKYNQLWPFGGSFVAHFNNEYYIKSFGTASFENKINNNSHSMYPLDSLTKAFTAYAVLILITKNKLLLTDPASNFLTEYNLDQRITINHLLQHSSGIKNILELKNIWKLLQSMNTELNELMKIAVSKPLDFRPGEKFNYSASGYILLKMIIERITGQSYSSFLNNEILVPLDMNETGFIDNEYHSKGQISKCYEISNNKYINEKKI